MSTTDSKTSPIEAAAGAPKRNGEVIYVAAVLAFYLFALVCLPLLLSAAGLTG